MTIGTGMLKAGVKLADVIASATGKQLNRLGTKLGMDKDMLKGMDANKIKTAIMDEGQVYIKNMRKNQNRRTGTAAITGLASGAAAYSVSDFIGDMLGIKKSGDATLKANEKPFVPKSKRKDPPARIATKKKSKTESYAEMVKKDKAKGKAKVLARRDKNKKPVPKPIPKGLRESIAKDKKIVKVTPKKKPVEKNKVEEKKKKQLMMKEKYTGNDSNVKFNSRGGMLKKGKK